MCPEREQRICPASWMGIPSDKRALLADLLNKNLNMEEKVSRIIALEAEEKNAEICDYIVRFDDAASAAREILDGLFPKKRKGKGRS